MAIVTSGLVGYWNALQGLSGNTWSNIAPSTQGQYDLAMSNITTDGSTAIYNGTTSYGKVLSPLPDYSNPTSFTVEVKFNGSNMATDPDILRAGTNSNTYPSNAYLFYGSTASNYWDTNFLYGENTVTDHAWTGQTIASNTDYHMAFVYDHAAKTVTMYKNGVSLGTQTLVNTNSYAVRDKANTYIFIGDTAYPFQGKVYFVRMYNTALSATDITNNYNNGNAVGINFFTKTLTDSISTSETVSKNYSKTVTESIATSEIFKKNSTKSLADSVLTSDSITVSTSKIYFKSLTDSIASADTFTKKDTKVLTDSIITSDSKYGKLSKNLNDFVNTNDSKYTTSSKKLNDSINTSDSKYSNLSKRVSDSINTNDSKQSTVKRIIQENIYLNDTDSDNNAALTFSENTVSNSNIEFINKYLLDSIILSDNVKKTRNLILRDNINVSDSIAKYFSKRYNESLLLTDSISTKKGAFILLVDSISLNEAKINKNYYKTINDGISLTESIAKFNAKIITEKITLSELLLKSLNKTLVNESISISDTKAGMNIIKKISDSIVLSDSKSKMANKGYIEYIGLEDSLVTSFRGNRLLSDNISVDYLFSIGSTRFLTITLHDSIKTSEKLIKQIGNKTLHDAILTNDSMHKKIIKSKFDVIYGVDNKVSKSLRKTFNEKIKSSDVMNKKSAFFIADSISFADSISKLSKKQIINSILMNDSLSKIYKKFINLSDNVTANESHGKTSSHNKIKSDIIKILESKLEGNITKKIYDDILLLDSTSFGKSILITDEIFTSDEIVAKAIMKRSLERIALIDSINKIQNRYINLGDNIILNDGIEKFEIHEYNELYEFILNFIMEQSFDINFAKSKDFDINF